MPKINHQNRNENPFRRLSSSSRDHASMRFDLPHEVVELDELNDVEREGLIHQPPSQENHSNILDAMMKYKLS